MKFQVTDGLNKVSIKLSEIGSYFYFKRPVTTVWYDCRGSVGKYLCLLPFDRKIIEEIKATIFENLNEDYTNRKSELKDLLNPLLKTFANGEYSLNYYHSRNSNYFQYHTSSDNYSTAYQSHWFMVFSEPIRLINKETIIKEHEIFVNERKEKKQVYWDLIDYTTAGFYAGSGSDKSFVATQPKAEINQERVKYFEGLISKGERPFAIILNCYYYQLSENTDKSISDQSLQSENYVLDGHHKLLAYENLKIIPSIVEITHLPKTRDEIEFNIEELIDVLYPWQIDHILKNWDNKDKFIFKFLENSKSKIHDFIRNGHFKECYANGRIKHEAFYINGKIEGEGTWWFENGLLEKKEIYKNGIRIGEWTSWYESGTIQFIQRFDEIGRLDGHLVSYYESGQIRWEQFLKNGVNKNGYSYLAWFEDGRKEAELKYLNGQMIERKNYNRQGGLVNFEEFDFNHCIMFH